MIKQNSMILLCENDINILSPEYITAITTVILALITGIYAFLTWKMVRIQKKEFEVSNRPYVSVMTMDKEIEGNTLKFSVAIKNSGKIPALLNSSEVIAYAENGIENKSLGKSLATIAINPGELIKKEIIKISDYTTKGNLTFIFEINYNSPIDNKNKAKYYTKYTYKFDSSKNYNLSIESVGMN